MTVRVTRLMEYTYEDAEQAIADMERWGVPANGVTSFNTSGTIRSAVIGPVFGEDAELIHTAVASEEQAGSADKIVEAVLSVLADVPYLRDSDYQRIRVALGRTS